MPDDGEDRPLDGSDMPPCVLRKGKGGCAVIPNNAEHGRIDQVVIDHLGTRHPPDFSGDRVFPDGRDADEVDDGMVEFHILNAESGSARLWHMSPQVRPPALATP